MAVGTGEQRTPFPSPPWGDTDPIDPSIEILRQHGVRLLDPTTAVRGRKQALRTTAYRADRLLVPFSLRLDADRWGRLERLLSGADEPPPGEPRRQPLTVTVDPLQERRARYLFEAGVADVAVEAVITPSVDRLTTTPPNAWEVLQFLRETGANDLAGVTLDHLMVAVRPPSMMHSIVDPTAGGEVGGSGYAPGGRTRMPVSIPLASRLRRIPDDALKDRRPTVAFLDTGCGTHPWLTDDVVDRKVVLDGELLGRDPGEPDPDASGDVVGPLDGRMDWVAGHGTFIAGVVRQACPDAQLLSIPVVHAEGVVAEADLNKALVQLLVLATRHARKDPGGRPVDVVSLSIGYYHETPAEAVHDAALRHVVEGFGRLGVPVVAAAGNEATVRPTVPASFAPHGDTQPSPEVVPLTSVGALNPDGSVALFSNAGPWVTAWAPGALMVSSLPTSFDTGARPASAFDQALPVDDLDAEPRSAIDPDDFSGGFAVWSGTSFAAPLVAGRIAERLLHLSESGTLPLSDPSPASRIRRGWRAVTDVTGVRP